MRCALVFLLVFSLLTGAAPVGVTLPDGTPVLLLTEEKMVSGETPEGSVALYRVERDVLGPRGQVLIPSGAKAYGKVLKSSGSGFLGTAGELSVTLESTVAADGTTVPLRTVREQTGDDPRAVMIAGAVVLSVFFLFMEGDDIEIPKGTLLTAYVNRDTVIARPAACRLSADQNSAPRSVTVLVPTPDGKLKKDDKIIFACSATPEEPGAVVRLWVDGELVTWQKGNLNKIVWDTTRNEKLLEQVGQPGTHAVTAEVTFSTGQTAKSSPVRFTLED